MCVCVSTDYTYTYVHICWHRFSSCFVARRELDGAISRQENPNVSFFPGSSSDSEDSVRALQVFGPFGVHSEGKKRQEAEQSGETLGELMLIHFTQR